MDGYYTGVMDLHYAVMETEDTPSTAPVYGAPKVLAKSIEVTVSPTYQEGKLDASNNRVRNVKKVVGYTVKAGVDRLAYTVLKELLGRVEDTAGVQVVRKTNDPPYVALAMVYTRDDGTKEYWWLYKGKFAEAERSGKTETPESVEYQTPSIEGVFVTRMDTGDVCAVADEDNDAIADSVFSGWTQAVYAAGADAQPGVDELPIGFVAAVAALPTADIDLTTVYVLTAADGAKGEGTMWRRIGSAWVEYGAA